MHAFEKLEPERLRDIAAALLGQDTCPEPGAAAAKLAELVSELGLSRRLRDVSIKRAALSQIVTLVAQHYPEDVNRLGENSESVLLAMLEAAW